MITDRPEWTTLVASPPGMMPKTPEPKRAWKALREACTAKDVEALGVLAATGTSEQQRAALWVLAFGLGSSLVTPSARPGYVANLETALHRSKLISHQWYHARNCLFDLEVEINPVDEDLRLRGITREEYQRLENEERNAEEASRQPPPVAVAAAVEAVVRAHPMPPVPEDLGRRLSAAAAAWRERQDHDGLYGVYSYVVSLAPATVSYRAIVDLLGAPNDYADHRAYYGNADSGLVILANAQGTIEGVKIN